MSVYDDSALGLCLDITGPDGNAFVILGLASNYAKQLDKDSEAILEEMRSDDYENLLDVFEREFGDVITLIGR